ncbi:hypothetical protein AN217_24770 [Streptomyces qinglanensis]|uniref:Peptidoglycan binding domain-containing protein n=1 Tax=Streptomyces qinglanensis TaxID=943816 RepID=A0A1E7K987_9ACTN|nr:hypothetical protein [Streptomyces qinglanensis]OEV00485.1 hypothetical protein AN217_24770 [Streptomyces qinglanensis]
MSRETDSSSSGPKGRGGSSYPSGTEPYGTPDSGADRDDRGAEPSAGSKPDEPRTETTLTTRIRINIPGSRPIPPVVMRTPVTDENADDTSGRADPAVGGRDAKGAPDLGAGQRATGGGSAAAVPPPAPQASPPGSPGSPGSPGGRAEAAPGAEEQFTQETSDWFAPRKSPRNSAPPPSPAAGGGPGGGVPGGAGGPDRGESPYPTGGPDPEPTGSHGIPEPTGSHGIPEPTGSHGIPGTPGAGPSFPGGTGPADTPPDGVPHLGTDPLGWPAGPTTGPASGDMPVPPARGVPGPGPGPLAAPGAGQGTDEGPGFDAGRPAGPGVPGQGGSGPDAFGRGPAGLADGPGGTPPAGTPRFPGGPEADRAGVPGAGPGAAAPGMRGGDARLSSDTMVSGPPRAAGGESDGADPAPGAGVPGPDDAPVPPPPQSAGGTRAPAKKRGRSKLVLAGVAVVGVVGVAYGTGLLLDHADVPRGTTVLGVEIGGLSKHEAVNKLDAELGDRTKEPFKIETSGGRTELKPGVAGVTLDTEATVRAAAGRDYNPVSVIGSLMGGTRQADPAITVDEAKVRAALKPVMAEAEAESPSEGMVKFTGGKAVAVKGSPHKVIDVDKAPAALEKAFRERAVSGENEPVALPGTVRKPKVTEAELNKAVKGFGSTAMSGWVWLRAGDVEVPFSQETMGKFLTMRAGGSGRLQPTIDPAKLKKTYGSAFDDVVIDGGAGTVRMTPKHAAVAMVEALRKKAPPEPGRRYATVPGSRSR